MRQPKKAHDSPQRGESSVSHTKTLISGRAQNQLHPPHIGGGLGGGGCFFASFFAPKRSTYGRLLPTGRKKVRNLF